jgi:hypothetical protein
MSEVERFEVPFVVGVVFVPFCPLVVTEYPFKGEKNQDPDQPFICAWWT